VPAVVDIKDAEAWVADLGPKLRRATVKGLHSAALRGVQVVVTQIIPSRSPQPVDRALYRGGWRAALLDDGADIENLEPHAVFIEDGVRAGNVKIGRKMLKALAEYALRKRLAANEVEAARVAWAIARTMQRRGIFGQRGLGVLRELVEKHLKKIVEEEVAREIERAT
jgi:hypothetical protein